MASTVPSTAACGTHEQRDTAQDYCTVEVKDGVAVIKLDQSGSKVNLLSERMMVELEKIYDGLASDQQVVAAVVISGKPAAFIAGADVHMLQAAKSAEEGTALSKNGQRLFDKLAKGKLPLVAAIHGDALGGGLELAMACHYRLAFDSRKTKFGLPEVKLGLLPGAGGTQRLLNLVPLPDALAMMLTGNTVTVQKAKELGLIDCVVAAAGVEKTPGEENPQTILEENAIRLAKSLAAGELKVNGNKPTMSVAAVTEFVTKKVPFVRNYILQRARDAVTKETKGRYPAPFMILDAVEAGLTGGMEAGLEREAQGFGELTQGPEAKNLMSLFFALQSGKKTPEQFGVPQREIKNLCVAGAGIMGSGIAEVSLGKFNLSIMDSFATGLAKGQAQLANALDKQVKNNTLTVAERDAIYSAVTAELGFKHFDKADLVIEAVPELLEIKHDVIKELETIVPEHCIIATNTSALPIEDVAKCSKRPENIIGMHYMFPVPDTVLLEIIPHAGTSKHVIAAAVEAGVRQGKSTIIVKDVPGFYVNRTFGPSFVETLMLLCEGVPAETLDKATLDFGFLYGFITLVDMIGLDTISHVWKFLQPKMGIRAAGVEHGLFSDIVATGMLGQKSGKGFYVYNGNKTKINEDFKPIVAKYKSSVDSSELPFEDIQMRIISRLLNEAAFSLQDKIILSPTDGDVGMIIGFGFPPFLGGPFRYMDSIGIQNFVDRLLRYRDAYGEHFTPAPILVDMAKRGETFYN